MRIQQSHPPQAENARQAAHWLQENGLPDNRLEHWRMTPIRRLLQQEFALRSLEGDFHARICDYCAGFSVQPRRLIVLVGGEYCAELSDLETDGLRISTRQEFSADVDFARLPFTAQNISLNNHPALVLELEAGVTLSEPVHLLQLHAGCGRRASFSQVEVRVNAGANMCLVESHLSLPSESSIDDYSAYSNAVVSVNIADGAHLSHYKWQNLDEAHLHIAASISTLAKDAVLDAFVLNMGGKLVRQDSEVIITQPDATATLNGAYIAHARQHIDNTSQIQHNAPDSYSREVYKGVLSEEAQGVFQARIRVDQCAQRTDAYQMNRALLLSSQAEVNCKPELEIYADDVKCSHGATVGQLDANQLFYLCARGISRKQAQMMLITAYLEDVFADMHNRELAEMFAKVSRGKLLEMASDRSLTSP